MLQVPKRRVEQGGAVSLLVVWKHYTAASLATARPQTTLSLFDRLPQQSTACWARLQALYNILRSTYIGIPATRVFPRCLTVKHEAINISHGIMSALTIFAANPSRCGERLRYFGRLRTNRALPTTPLLCLGEHHQTSIIIHTIYIYASSSCLKNAICLSGVDNSRHTRKHSDTKASKSYKNLGISAISKVACTPPPCTNLSSLHYY